MTIPLSVHATERDMYEAEENKYGDPIPIELTAYCIDGTTASGKHTREGIVAGKKEWIGMTVILYDENMEYIGTYEVLDTGGKKIRQGKVIDIWLPTYDECIQFGRQKGYYQLIDAKG